MEDSRTQIVLDSEELGATVANNNCVAVRSLLLVESAYSPFGNENPLGFWIRPVAGGVPALHCNLAEAHGQLGWLAWMDAVVLEAMSVACGLEMRRRKSLGQSVRMPFAVLVVAVGLSLAAQVIEAEQSIIGWVAAAIPSLGFLAQAKMILGRHSKVDSAISTPTEMAAPKSPALPEAPVSPAVSPAAVAHATATAKRTRTERKPYGPRDEAQGYSERQERRQRTGR